MKELRIGYQPSPIQDASIAMFETWGAKNGVKIVKVPNSYGVYVEKMTASLTSNSDQYDVIWHNDDWGQTWAHLLEPTDDVEANKFAEKWGMDKIVFGNAKGQNTVVPMGQTFSVFFYRSDLVKPEEVPKTLDELVTIEQEAAGRRQGQVRLCRRHVDEQQLVQLVLVDVGQQLRRADAALRARQQEARRRRLEVGHDRALHAEDRRILVGCDQHPQDRAARHAGL